MGPAESYVVPNAAQHIIHSSKKEMNIPKFHEDYYLFYLDVENKLKGGEGGGVGLTLLKRFVAILNAYIISIFAKINWEGERVKTPPPGSDACEICRTKFQFDCYECWVSIFKSYFQFTICNCN